jgi:hypothetical protein
MNDSNADYLKNCAQSMNLRYGGPVRIRIAKRGDPKFYPHGAWFDNRIGQILEPAGLDLDATPPLFVMANGDLVSMNYVEVIEKGMITFGRYYVQFKFEQPYYVRPESGDNMWQVSLGFVTITRMG